MASSDSVGDPWRRCTRGARSNGTHGSGPASAKWGAWSSGTTSDNPGIPANVIELSSDSSKSYSTDEEEGPWFVNTRLYPPFASHLEVFGNSLDWGNDRWVLIHITSGRIYRVFLVKKPHYYILTKGWNLLFVCEGLRGDQPVRFEYHGDYLTFSTRKEEHHPPEGTIGFEKAWTGDTARTYTSLDYHDVPGTVLNDRVLMAMHASWNASVSDRPMYVCTINKSQATSNSIFFSAKYSEFLPAKKETVAMRFIGSPVTTNGSIESGGNDKKRIGKGWKQFVEFHQIQQGDVLVFRCYKGPAVWEFLICRA